MTGKRYTYDSLERVVKVQYHMGSGYAFEESFTYVDEGSNTSGLVATHTVDGVVYAYTYDGVGNITTVKENGVLRASYQYDSLGQLKQASYVNGTYGDNYEYRYDKSGNITNVYRNYGVDYLYGQSKAYTYGNTSWGDLLTSYNGTAITYDAIGNPTKWRNAIDIEWYGRQLTHFQHPDYSLSGYSYNAYDIRSNKKSVDANANIIGGKNCYCCISNMALAENKQRKNI